MLQKFISYFVKNHLLVNFIFISCFLFGFWAWNNIKKEELPDIALDFVRVTVNWSGASANDVDYFVLQPLEDNLKNVLGIDEIRSTARQGQATIHVDLSSDYERQDIINEINVAVNGVKLPVDAKDPRVREFKASQKAIIDIAIYNTNQSVLNDKSRAELQLYASALQNYLLSSAAITDVSTRGYLAKRVNIYLDSDKLIEYGFSIQQIANTIKNNSLKQPVGIINADWEDGVKKSNDEQKPQVSKRNNQQVSRKKNKNREVPVPSSDTIASNKELRTYKRENRSKNIKISVDAELDTVEELQNLVVRADFSGKPVYLKDIADVSSGFKDKVSIFKMNGYESLVMTVKKSSKWGIIEAAEEVKSRVASFQKGNLDGTTIEVDLSDDESTDVRNRLAIIRSNAILGFLLIIVMLFVFINFKSSFWVAMGIPFTFCVTIFFAHFVGYTINNITLAAIIVVMGIVVDDAIIVAESISRLVEEGLDKTEAAIKGTVAVLLPITASIITTCIAFVPFFFFSGRTGLMAKFIPPIIFMMLFASLLEAIFILPSHLSTGLPRWIRLLFSLGTLSLFEKYYLRPSKNKKDNIKKPVKVGRVWIRALENRYGQFLQYLLSSYKLFFFIGCLVLIGLAMFLYKTFDMKFVMHPRAKSASIYIVGNAANGADKLETERRVSAIETIIERYRGKEVLNYETRIAQSRRGNEAVDNSFSIFVYLTAHDKRKKSNQELQKEWEQEINELTGFKSVRFIKRRFSSGSETPIEILVQHNDDDVRNALASLLKTEMEEYKTYTNVEVESQLNSSEYRLNINNDLAARLSINPTLIIGAVRDIVNGRLLYAITRNDEDIQYMLTINPKDKYNINKILDIPVQNSGRYFVPLKSLVTLEKTNSQNLIKRVDTKRTIRLYASLQEGSKQSPVQTAVHFEQNIFPKLLAQYPTAQLKFTGEVETTREASNEFEFALILVIVSIFIVIALLYNSLFLPLIIMFSIPFSIVGVIFAFVSHGMNVYGFYSVVGVLGLCGVVINDSIVMLDKLLKEINNEKYGAILIEKVANISKTRLRAVILTTFTTVAGLLPTAYGIFGYDSMLSDMMLAMCWGLMFGTIITLFLIPTVFCVIKQVEAYFTKIFDSHF